MNESLPTFFHTFFHTLSHVLPFFMEGTHQILKSLFPHYEFHENSLLLGLICILLSLVFRFYHDLLSQFVSFIRICVERRKPEAVDETIPFLTFTAIIPSALILLFAKGHAPLPFIAELEYPLLLIGMVSAGFLFWAETRMNHSKTFAYWNFKEAMILGLFSILSPLLNIPFFLTAFIIARLRGFKTDAASKFILLSLMPLILIKICMIYTGFHEILHDQPTSVTAITALTSIGVSWFFIQILTGYRPPSHLTKASLFNFGTSLIGLILWYKMR